MYELTPIKSKQVSILFIRQFLITKKFIGKYILVD